MGYDTQINAGKNVNLTFKSAGSGACSKSFSNASIFFSMSRILQVRNQSIH